MTDTVIKGTGNSRLLKSVPNLRTLAPTWDAALDLFTGTGFPVDLSGLQTAGVSTAGTSFSKANMLPNTLCTALGLATTATPAQALEKLRTLTATAQTTATGKCQMATGSYVGTGLYGAANPCSITFPFVPKIVIVPSRRAVSGTTQVAASIIREMYSSWLAVMSNVNTEYEERTGLWQGSYGQSYYSYGKKTADGKTYYWYSTNSSDAQLNIANVTYYWVAIG